MCGCVIAGRQIYLQNLPTDQVPTCAPPMDFLMDTLPIFEVIQTILLGDGNCAEYEWRFIFNFAEWALIFFVFLLFYNFFFLFKKSVKT
jgi:disulfide bond formation protein DsbB